MSIWIIVGCYILFCAIITLYNGIKTQLYCKKVDKETNDMIKHLRKKETELNKMLENNEISMTNYLYGMESVLSAHKKFNGRE